MKRFIAVFVAVMSCCSAAVAQENISLGELLRTGLENNYSVRIVRNSQEISDNNVTLANAGFLPSVGLSGGYTGNHDHTSTTPIGGDAATNNALNHTANLGLNTSWTLFNGFRIQTNYKRLQELQQQGEINTRMRIEDFIAELSSQYYNLIRQRVRLQNYAYSMELSRERMEIERYKHEFLFQNRPAYLQSLVYYNTDSSRYMSQLPVIREIQINIRELLADTDYTVPVYTADSEIIINPDLDFEELKRETLANNAILMSSDKDIQLAELDLQTLRARNYPYVNIGAGYGYTFNRYGNSTNRQRENLGLNFGVTLGFTIFDGNRRREQQNARIQINSSKLRREQAEAAVLADLVALWTAYRDNLHIINMEQANLLTARDNFQVAMDNNRAGTISGIEMREAQTNLLNAEERLITAIYNAKLCEISLLQLSGGIVEYTEL